MILNFTLSMIIETREIRTIRAKNRNLSTVKKLKKTGALMKFHRSTESIYHMFKRVRAWAKYHDLPLSSMPVVDFTATVKLHGTNAGIVLEGNGVKPVAVARSRVATVNSDNAGFAMFLESVPQSIFDEMYANLTEGTDWAGQKICVFGEWCGGNIQGGVALNQVPKHFVAFNLYVYNNDSVDDEEPGRYVGLKPEVQYNDRGIYNISQGPTYKFVIDFGKEDHSDVVEYLTKLVEQVEAEDPWCKTLFGVSGIGEGIVAFATNDPGNSEWTFKVKGEKHSVRGSKDKKIVAIDVEKVNTINECIDIILTENRMQQMINDNGFSFDPRNIGPFLKAVCIDCVKEEIDVVVENGLTWDDVSKVVQSRARNWFLEKSQTGKVD